MKFHLYLYLLHLLNCCICPGFGPMLLEPVENTEKKKTDLETPSLSAGPGNSDF